MERDHDQNLNQKMESRKIKIVKDLTKRKNSDDTGI